MFEDTASGARATPWVIWRLDRLGRSLKDLIRLVEQLDAVGVGLRSLQESIDTTSIGAAWCFTCLVPWSQQPELAAAMAAARNGSVRPSKSWPCASTTSENTPWQRSAS